MPQHPTGITHETSGEIASPHIGTYELGNTELPIALHRSEIERAIAENPVTILVAPTGSGKTTQVPQFALEMGQFDDILVTQPRIIAARTVSERVRDEIRQKGRSDAIGYYTSKESTDAPQSEQDIAFLTDGKAAVQLLYRGKRAQEDRRRLLIIDEVHEWNLNIELLLALVVDKTDPASYDYDPNLKVVIMSATMDSKGLQNHFNHTEPPLIQIDVPTFPVEHSVTKDSAANVSAKWAQGGAKVLTFLPGVTEIKRVKEAIRRTNPKVPVVPLHGRLPADQQRRAFENYRTGVVIATTNVAQTSVTVEGAQVVVDTGMHRTDRVRYDIDPKGTNGLYLEHTSRADMDQRAGRTGRTGPGRHILASTNRDTPLSYWERPQYHDPAMWRSRLDNLVLRIRSNNIAVKDLKFFHEPNKVALKAAKKRLETLGALDETGDITTRGRLMSRLAMDAEYAAMIAFAYEKRYSNEIKSHLVNIVAIMQLGGIFKRAPKDQEWRELLATDARGNTVETESDFLAQLETYFTLTTKIDRREWSNYDVNEHVVELVKRDRDALVKLLGFQFQDLQEISEKDRKALLTCINAGQLNQLWRRSGNGWTLVFGDSETVDQSRSSVVGPLGKLATGQMFSLGLDPDDIGATIHTVTDMNIVPDLDSLAESAKHLIVEVPVRDTERYDPHSRKMMVEVVMTLGGLTLGKKLRVVENIPGGVESRKLEALYRSNLLADWVAYTEFKPKKYTNVEAIMEAIEEPECYVFGRHHITGEPMKVWRGGKGQLCRSRAIAIDSLEARKKHLEKREERIARKIEKAEQRRLEAKRRRLSNLDN